MTGKECTRDRIEQVLAKVAEGTTIYGACKQIGISRQCFYERVERFGLEKEHKTALAACEQSRIAWAWQTLTEAAVHDRDVNGAHTAAGVKAALAVLYSRGELVDSRKVSMEHSGGIATPGLAEIFAEAAKRGEKAMAQESKAAAQ